MTYLKPTTCELLHKLGVKCKTGKSWGKMYGNAGADPWCDHVISEMDERETRFTWIPAYSLPLLITDSEAMRDIFGEQQFTYWKIFHGYDRKRKTHYSSIGGGTEVTKDEFDKNVAEAKKQSSDAFWMKSKRSYDDYKTKEIPEKMGWKHNAHQLLDLCLSGDYEAAEQLLVEALTERVK